jgi:hypothetical protein
MKIKNIRKIDDELFEVMKTNFHNALPTFSKVGFNYVGKALTMFVTKTNFIKNAIFDVCENDDPYSANILLRSLIEHHLKFMFIFIRHTKEESDTVGIEYYKLCDLYESAKIGKSWLESWEILTPENEDKLYKIITDNNPEISGFSKKDVFQKVQQFNYKNIIPFIRNSIELIKQDYGWLDMVIPNYGDLSSYVHGGPLAEKSFIYLSNADKREHEIINVCNIAFLSANILKQFTYLLLAQLDKVQYTDSLNEIDKLIEKYKKLK